MFTAVGGSAVQEETPTVGVVIGAGQIVLVQTLTAVAGAAVHDATGVGPVVMGAGQVVVVQRVAKVGPDAAHDNTGTSRLLLVPQPMSTQPLAALAVCGVPVSTGVFAVVTV